MATQTTKNFDYPLAHRLPHIMMVFLGIILLITSVFPLFNMPYVGLHLTAFHCTVLAVSGLLAVWAGLGDSRKVFWTALCLGVVFSASYLGSFFFGYEVLIEEWAATPEQSAMVVAPGALHLGAFDFFLHGIAGISFLVIAFYWVLNHSEKRMIESLRG